MIPSWVNNGANRDLGCKGLRVIHILCMQKITFFEPPPLLHCIHFVDPHVYVQSCTTPSYKIVMPYQISYLNFKFTCCSSQVQWGD